MSDPVFIALTNEVFVDRAKIESVQRVENLTLDEPPYSYTVAFKVTMDSGAFFYVRPREGDGASLPGFIRHVILHRSNGEVIT